MKEVNLEEILAKWISYKLQQLGKSKESSDVSAKTSIEGGANWYILEAMKEVCKQVLELAAENAELENVIKLIGNQNKYNAVVPIVKKQSILNTINQVK